MSIASDHAGNLEEPRRRASLIHRVGVEVRFERRITLAALQVSAIGLEVVAPLGELIRVALREPNVRGVRREAFQGPQRALIVGQRRTLTPQDPLSFLGLGERCGVLEASSNASCAGTKQSLLSGLRSGQASSNLS